MKPEVLAVRWVVKANKAKKELLPYGVAIVLAKQIINGRPFLSEAIGFP